MWHKQDLYCPSWGRNQRLIAFIKCNICMTKYSIIFGDIDGIAWAFKAVTFFFELERPLALEGGRYHCRGSILSRSPDSRNFIQNIGALTQMRNSSTTISPLVSLVQATSANFVGAFKNLSPSTSVTPLIELTCSSSSIGCSGGVLLDFRSL